MLPLITYYRASRYNRTKCTRSVYLSECKHVLHPESIAHLSNSDKRYWIRYVPAMPTYFPSVSSSNSGVTTKKCDQQIV